MNDTGGPDVALLRCPSCAGEKLTRRDGALSCPSCGDEFPVRNGDGCFQREFDDYSENYDRICEDDVREPKTPTAVKEIFTQLVAERARGVVCDVGCGAEYVITRVGGRDRVALDLALPYLERLPASITRLWSRIENAPIRSAAADTVVCTDLLEHVLEPERVAGEIGRVLKPGGRALLAFPFEQDLSVYDLADYKRKCGKYKFVHLRSIDDGFIERLFPRWERPYERLITEGMPLMEFKPFPIKFVELVRP